MASTFWTPADNPWNTPSYEVGTDVTQVVGWATWVFSHPVRFCYYYYSGASRYQWYVSSDTPFTYTRNGGSSMNPSSGEIDGRTFYWVGNVQVSPDANTPPQSTPAYSFNSNPTSLNNPEGLTYMMAYGTAVKTFTVSYSLTHVTYDSNNPTTIDSDVTEETARTFTLYVDENYEIDNNTISVSNCSYEYETTGDGKIIYLHLYAPTDDVVITAAAGTDDPYSGEGDGSIGGADVGVPGLPTLGNVSAGLFSLFAPTAAQMNALADFLWTDIDFSQVISAPDQLSALNAIANIFQELGEAFKREIANPAKMIFGLSIIPSQGLAIGGAANVKIGFVDTGVAMNILTNRYFSVDCGGVSISPVCGDTFLDYAPYSKFSIYLPYIGVKPLDANDCVGHTISVKYNCDAVSGGCVCYVCKDGAVYYQYAGNIAMNLPLSSESWANTIAAAMNTASQLAAGIASGGVAGAGAAALQAASNVAANPSQLSPQIDHSGAVNGAAGYLGVQYPYIIREAVRFLDTAGMNQVKGYPSHYLTKLSNLSGYTEVLECHLEGIKATENELNEIENLLKSGVII